MQCTLVCLGGGIFSAPVCHFLPCKSSEPIVGPCRDHVDSGKKCVHKVMIPVNPTWELYLLQYNPSWRHRHLPPKSAFRARTGPDVVMTGAEGREGISSTLFSVHLIPTNNVGGLGDASKVSLRYVEVKLSLEIRSLPQCFFLHCHEGRKNNNRHLNATSSMPPSPTLVGMSTFVSCPFFIRQIRRRWRTLRAYQIPYSCT